MANASNPTRPQFGKLIPNIKHWEHAERARIAIRAAQANRDHAEVSRLAYQMRVNF